MKFRKFHNENGVQRIFERREILDMLPPPLKEYPRFPRIALPKPGTISANFSSVLDSRVSALSFDPKESLSLEHLANILDAGGGVLKRTDKEARRHPSAGALFPLEYYVVPYRVEKLSQRFHHYAPLPHALEEMVSSPEIPPLSRLWHDPLPELEPAAAIVITAVWGRIYPKYGEFSYRLALLEAGHSAQDMLLAAAAIGVNARPIGSIVEKSIVKLLDLEGFDEDPLYMIFVGK